VRPTTERAREALFSVLEPRLTGATVLDAFAGSGALGLEALSRGASRVDFVELSVEALRAIRSNIERLGVEGKTHVYRRDALRYVRKLGERAYDVALADPPYTTNQAAELVEVFRTQPFAELLSVEHRAGVECGGDETRRYGDVALTFCFAP
jgi:16S rRNA (guanine966-N2)-methyltransferase